MSNLTITSSDAGQFEPHPEGISPAVCVGIMDLGLVESDYQGQKSLKQKIKLTFETEARTKEGTPCTVSKSFTASLHPKSSLASFLGKWRGRPVDLGETIDLTKLVGACCTLVLSHQTSERNGKVYATIDAVSKPTKKLVASGTYDPAAAEQRYAEWKLKQAGAPGAARPMVAPTPARAAAPVAAVAAVAAPAAVVADDDVPF